MARRHPHASTRIRVISAAFVVVLTGIALLGYRVARDAQEAVLDSQSGSVNAVALDPTAPGFRAFTEPTPTALVLHTTVTNAGRAELVGLTFLAAARTSDGGTVITIPSGFVHASGTGTPLDVLFETEGFDAVVDEVRAATAIGFDDVVVLDASAWTTLMTTDLPLEMSLRDDLIENVSEEETRTVLESATRPFDLNEIALIASHRNPGEASLGVARRQQEIWRAWISRTAAAVDRPELFSVEGGFVDVIGALAEGEVNYRTIPTTTVSGEQLVDTTYVAEPREISELISIVVPFPLSPSPGARPDVMLLDGTGGRIDQADLLGAIVRGGGQVAILGNAESTQMSVSTVQVHSPDAFEIAELIAVELGSGPPTDVPLTEQTVSITVTVGADLLAGP